MWDEFEMLWYAVEISRSAERLRCGANEETASSLPRMIIANFLHKLFMGAHFGSVYLRIEALCEELFKEESFLSWYWSFASCSCGLKVVTTFIGWLWELVVVWMLKNTREINEISRLEIRKISYKRQLNRELQIHFQSIVSMNILDSAI